VPVHTDAEEIVGVVVVDDDIRVGEACEAGGNRRVVILHVEIEILGLDRPGGQELPLES
jgi:hypothetical protein